LLLVYISWRCITNLGTENVGKALASYYCTLSPQILRQSFMQYWIMLMYFALCKYNYAIINHLWIETIQNAIIKFKIVLGHVQLKLLLAAELPLTTVLKAPSAKVFLTPLQQRCAPFQKTGCTFVNKYIISCKCRSI